MPSSANEDPRAELTKRCDIIEEAYEFMLAYASQGLSSDHGSATGGQVREYLKKCNTALTGLADVVRDLVTRADMQPAEPYRDFAAVIEHDSANAGAAVRLVLAQPAISSQTVDNLNASMHVRAILTDLFLIDEVLKAPPAS